MDGQKLTTQQFAKKIREKYNDYHDVADDELVSRILGKYPDYADSVQLSPSAPKTAVKPVRSAGLASNDIPKIVDRELAGLGYSPSARLALIGNLGRENSWNLNTIFGNHADPKNNATNSGIVSYQGDRRTALQNYLRQNGGDWAPNERNLRLQVQFLDNEMKSRNPNSWNAMRNAADTQSASLALHPYINYSIGINKKTGKPWHSFDDQFHVKANRIWAEKARKLGVGGDVPTGIQPQSYGVPAEDAPRVEITGGTPTELQYATPENLAKLGLQFPKTPQLPATPQNVQPTEAPEDYMRFGDAMPTSAKTIGQKYALPRPARSQSNNQTPNFEPNFEQRQIRSGEQYFAFEKTGVTENGEKYLGTKDGKYFFENADGDRLEGVLNSKGELAIKPVSPFVKKIKLSNGSELVRDDSFVGNEKERQYLDAKGTKIIVSADGKLREANPKLRLTGEGGEILTQTDDQADLEKKYGKNTVRLGNEKGENFIVQKAKTTDGKDSYKIIKNEGRPYNDAEIEQGYKEYADYQKKTDKTFVDNAESKAKFVESLKGQRNNEADISSVKSNLAGKPNHPVKLTLAGSSSNATIENGSISGKLNADLPDNPSKLVSVKNIGLNGAKLSTSTANQTLGQVEITRKYKSRPSFEQIYQDSLIGTYGDNIGEIMSAYKDQTGNNLLEPRSEARDAIEKDIDYRFDKKTGNYTFIAGDRYAKVQRMVDAYNKGGIEGLKAEIGKGNVEQQDAEIKGNIAQTENYIKNFGTPKSDTSGIRLLTPEEAEAKTRKELETPTVSDAVEKAGNQIASDIGKLVISPFYLAYSKIEDLGKTIEDLSATDDERINSQLAEIKAQNGSLSEYQKHREQYNQMSGVETGARLFGEFTRGVVNTAVTGTLQGIDFVDALNEQYNPIFAVLPDKVKPSVRNLTNGLAYAIAYLQDPEKAKTLQLPSSADSIDKRLLTNIAKSIDESLGNDEVLKGRFIGTLAQGAGSGAAFMLMGMVAPEFSIGKFSGTSAALGALTSAGSGYNEAKQAMLAEAKSRGLTGKDAEDFAENRAKISGVINGLAGASEGFGIGSTINKSISSALVKKNVFKGLLDSVKELGKDVVKDGGEEFIQEIFQTTAGKATMEYLKDKDPSAYQKIINAINRLPKQVASSVANEGLSALITGGAFGGIGGVASNFGEQSDIRFDLNKNQVKIGKEIFEFNESVKPAVAKYLKNQDAIEAVFTDIQELEKQAKNIKDGDKNAVARQNIRLQKEAQGLIAQSGSLIKEIESGIIRPETEESKVTISSLEDAKPKVRILEGDQTKDNVANSNNPAQEINEPASENLQSDKTANQSDSKTQLENPNIKFAKKEDGSLKVKSEYTPEEFKDYTDSVIKEKLKKLNGENNKNSSETSPTADSSAKPFNPPRFKMKAGEGFEIKPRTATNAAEIKENFTAATTEEVVLNKDAEILNLMPKSKTPREIFATPKAHLSEMLEASYESFGEVYDAIDKIDESVKDIKKQKNYDKTKVAELTDRKNRIQAVVAGEQQKFVSDLEAEIKRQIKTKYPKATDDQLSGIAVDVGDHLLDGRLMETDYNKKTVQEYTADLIDEFAEEEGLKLPAKTAKVANISEKPNSSTVAENAQVEKEPYEITRLSHIAKAKQYAYKDITGKDGTVAEITRFFNANPDVKNSIAGNVDEYHYADVGKALKEGKTVPAEVLADYPDLAKQYGKDVKVLTAENKLQEPVGREVSPTIKEIADESKGQIITAKPKQTEPEQQNKTASTKPQKVLSKNWKDLNVNQIPKKEFDKFARAKEGFFINGQGIRFNPTGKSNIVFAESIDKAYQSALNLDVETFDIWYMNLDENEFSYTKGNLFAGSDERNLYDAGGKLKTTVKETAKKTILERLNLPLVAAENLQSETTKPPTVHTTDLNKVFDEEFDKLFGEKETKNNELNSAMADLAEIFGDTGFAPLKSAVKDSEAAFDEETYAKTKIPLQKAFDYFKNDVTDVRGAMSNLLQKMNEAGFQPETIRKMKPYFVRFVEENTLQNEENKAFTSKKEKVRQEKLSKLEKNSARKDGKGRQPNHLKHSLSEYVALSGGINDNGAVDVSELRGQGLSKFHPLVKTNGKGLSAEDMFRRVLESGYLTGENIGEYDDAFSNSNFGVNEFIRAVADDYSGGKKKYSAENIEYQEFAQEFPVSSEVFERAATVADFLTNEEVQVIVKKLEKDGELSDNDREELFQIGYYEKGLDRQLVNDTIRELIADRQSGSNANIETAQGQPEIVAEGIEDSNESRQSVYTENLDESDLSDADFSFDFGENEKTKNQPKERVFSKLLSVGTLYDNSFAAGLDGKDATDTDLIKAYQYTQFANYLLRYNLADTRKNNAQNVLGQAGNQDKLTLLVKELEKRGLMDDADNYYIDTKSLQKPANNISTDLFGNSLEAKFQDTLFNNKGTDTEAENALNQELVDAYGSKTAKFVRELAKNANPLIARTADDLLKARKLVIAKGDNARSLVETAADALESFVKAQNGRMTVAEQLTQRGMFGNELSDEAVKFAEQMEGGTFSGKFNKALSDVENRQNSVLKSVANNESGKEITYNGKNYEETRNVAERIRRGEYQIERLDSASEQGRIAGGQRNVEASLILAGSEKAVQGASPSNESRLEALANTIKRQEQVLEGYAKENDIWFKQGHFPERLYLGRGGEALVYQKDENRVVKLIDPRHIDRSLTPQKFLDSRISLFNSLFPATRYELMGFMRDSQGKFRIIVTQNLIQGTPVAEQAEADRVMTARGFGRTGKESYSNSLYQIHDLHVGNVLKDANNNVFVIDAVPKFNFTPQPLRVVQNTENQADNPILKSISSVEDWNSAEYEKQLDSIKLERNSDGKILAPNGEISNIQNERQAKQIRSKEFIEFFGDWKNNPKEASKVVDEHGEPLVVYHGTNADIDVFNRATNTRGYLSEGIYFTSKQSVAGLYGNKVMSVFLNIREPDIFNANNQSFDNKADELSQILKHLGKFGNDGVIIANIYDHPRGKRQGQKSTVFVADSPNQIKSAIGNRGSFSEADDSILKKIGGETSPEERQTLQEMAEMQYYRLEDVLPRAEFTRYGDKIEVNAASHELFRRALEEIKIQEKQIKRDSTDTEGGFKGVFLDDVNTAKVARIFREKAKEAEKGGWTTPEIETLNDHAEVLEAAAKEGHKTAIVYTLASSLPEELFHQADYLGAVDKSLLNRHTPAYAKFLDNHVVAQTLRIKHFDTFSEYRRMTNKTRKNAVIRAEIPPLLLELSDEQIKDLGLTKDQVADYLLNWFTGYAKKGNSFEFFDKENSAIQDYVKRITESIKRENERARGENGENSRIGQEPARANGIDEKGDRRSSGDDLSGRTAEPAENQTTGNQTEARGNAGSRVDDNAENSENDGMNKRSVVRQMEERGYINDGDIAGEAAYYQTKSRNANVAVAQARIEKQGLATSVLEASKPYETATPEETAFRMEVAELLKEQSDNARANGKDEIADAKYAEALNVLSELAINATAQGQAISQLANWSKENPKTVSLYVEKARRQNGVIEPLTPERRQDLENSAIEAANANLALAETQKDLDNARNAIEYLEKVLDKSETATTRNKETIAELKKEVKKYQRLAADKIEREGVKRPFSSAAQKERITNLSNDRDALIARMQARFGGNMALKSIAAWHGSPHRFDKFDISKIGSGEGNQTYGYGLYFTDSEQIADFYKENIKTQVNGVVLENTNYSVDDIYAKSETDAKYLAFSLLVENGNYHDAKSEAWDGYKNNQEQNADLSDLYYDAYDFLDNNLDIEIDKKPPTRAKYKVTLAPDEHELLDWDKKPNSKIIRKIFNGLNDLGVSPSFAKNGIKFVRDNKITMEIDLVNGSTLYNGISSVFQGSDQKASEYLKSLGIRGIKYLDGTSRNKGEGSYNYVIFDDADVEINEILKSVAPETAAELDDQTRQDLVDLVAFDIYTKLPQKEVWNKLLNVTQNEFSKADYESVYVEAYESIYPPRTENASNTNAKIVGEHRAFVNKIRNQNKLNKFSLELSKRGQAKGIDENIIAGALYLNKPQDKQDLVNKMREFDPSLTGPQALDAATQAVKLRKETFAELAKERAEKKALETTLSEQITIGARSSRNAYSALNRRIEALSKPDITGHARFVRAYKSALVSAFSTSFINFVGGNVNRGINVLTDAVEISLNKALKTTGTLGSDVKYGDMFGITGSSSEITKLWNELATASKLGWTNELGINANAQSQRILDRFPAEAERLFKAYNSDLDVTKADKKGLGIANGAEFFLDKANYFNKLQEFFMRQLEFNRSLQMRVGSRGLNLEEIINQGDWKKFTQEDLDFAINNALSVTFAKTYNNKGSQAFTTMLNLPVLKYITPFIAPFPNFMMNALDTTTELMPIISQAKNSYKNYESLKKQGVDANILNGIGQLNSRDAAKFMIGTVLVLTATAIKSQLGDDDDWKKLRIPFITNEKGEPFYIDAGNWFPFTPFLYVGDKINRIYQGKAVFSGNESEAEEFVDAFTGFSSKQLEQNNVLRLIKTIPTLTDANLRAGLRMDFNGEFENEADRKGAEFSFLLQKTVGDIFGAFTRPLKPLKNLVDGVLSKNQPDKRGFPLANTLEQNFPFVNHFFDDEKDVFGKPIVVNAPILRIFGFNLQNPSFHRDIPTKAMDKVNELMFNSPKEKSLLPEEVKKRAYKAQLYKAIENAGTDTAKQTEVVQVIDKLVSDGTFTADQMDYVKRVIGLSPFESKAKGLSGEQLKSVMPYANADEKKVIESLLSKKAAIEAKKEDAADKKAETESRINSFIKNRESMPQAEKTRYLRNMLEAKLLTMPEAEALLKGKSKNVVGIVGANNPKEATEIFTKVFHNSDTAEQAELIKAMQDKQRRSKSEESKKAYQAALDETRNKP